MKKLAILLLVVMALSAGCGNRTSSQDVSPIPVSSDYEEGYEDGVEDGMAKWENEAIEDYEENGVDYSEICSDAMKEKKFRNICIIFQRN